jgi:hypothetical protein
VTGVGRNGYNYSFSKNIDSLPEQLVKTQNTDARIKFLLENFLYYVAVGKYEIAPLLN